jgi:hypothetical protein
MDSSQLGEAFAIVAITVVIGRFVLRPIGNAGDVLAGLFVPPDRSLGWPHGVQESDEPWGWRQGRPPAPAVFGGRDALDDGEPAGGPTGPDLDAAIPVPRSGTLVVPVGRVSPVRLGLRPH